MNAGTVSAMKVATGAMKNQMMDPDEMVDVMDDAREQVRSGSRRGTQSSVILAPNYLPLPNFNPFSFRSDSTLVSDGPIRRAERAACGAHDALHGRGRREHPSNVDCDATFLQRVPVADVSPNQCFWVLCRTNFGTSSRRRWQRRSLGQKRRRTSRPFWMHLCPRRPLFPSAKPKVGPPMFC
jgi:hypothetical protein